ncbi:hypothetical protein VTO73DRAFT_3010 [Trametes versicolor]
MLGDVSGVRGRVRCGATSDQSLSMQRRTLRFAAIKTKAISAVGYRTGGPAQVRVCGSPHRPAPAHSFGTQLRYIGLEAASDRTSSARDSLCYTVPPHPRLPPPRTRSRPLTGASITNTSPFLCEETRAAATASCGREEAPVA